MVYTSIKIIAVDILMNRNRPYTLELKAAQKKKTCKSMGMPLPTAENQGPTENL